MKQRERTFQPDYGIERPQDGGITGIAALVCRWSARGALFVVAAFLLGFFGHHFGVF